MTGTADTSPRSSVEGSVNLRSALHALPLYAWGLLAVICGVIMVDRVVVVFSYSWVLPLFVGLVLGIRYLERYRRNL